MIMKLCSNNMLEEDDEKVVEEEIEAKARHANLCTFVVFGNSI
jgi:hypothetical protein